jgi:hypothetical protein
MKMQRFTGWLTRILNALPWRRSRRQARKKASARAFSSRQAVFSDLNRITQPPPPEITRRPSPWLEELSPPRSKPPMPPAEPAAASRALVPVTPPPAPKSPAPPAELTAAPEADALDAERRLTFARYLVRRGTFNAGFTPEILPTQYQQREEA